MANAIMADLGDALVTDLLAHDFDLSFVAERSYADWAVELAQETELRVDIVPAAFDMKLGTRASTDYVCGFDIGVRQKFGQDKQGSDGRLLLDEVDALVKLVQDIHEYVCSPGARRLPSFPDAVWAESKVRALFMPDQLRSNRQFTGIIRVSYDVTADLN